jgi:hypothetical protein
MTTTRPRLRRTRDRLHPAGARAMLGPSAVVFIEQLRAHRLKRHCGGGRAMVHGPARRHVSTTGGAIYDILTRAQGRWLPGVPAAGMWSASKRWHARCMCEQATLLVCRAFILFLRLSGCPSVWADRATATNPYGMLHAKDHNATLSLKPPASCWPELRGSRNRQRPPPARGNASPRCRQSLCGGELMPPMHRSSRKIQGRNCRFH